MTTSDNTAAVLELLASRICHDLISPVGAVNNGVEFMQDMGPESADEALSLISYSAAQAAAKLAAFRLAYGAGGRDPNIKPEDVQRAFSALVSAEGKISQTWDPFGPLGPSPLPPVFCKMLMCGMMLAAEFLPKGGTVSVKPGEGPQTLIISEGKDATVRDQVTQALERSIPPENLDPRLVHPYAISVLADNYGFGIAITTQEEGRVVLTLTSPQA